MEGIKKRPAKINEASRIALRLILVTAQRPGEVLGLPWAELSTDWETSKEPAWTLPKRTVEEWEEAAFNYYPLAVDLLERGQGPRWRLRFCVSVAQGRQSPDDG